MSADFKTFIMTVKIDIKSKKIHKKEYNEVFDLQKQQKPLI